jgi:CO/xanthine dehydrogenase Mo-binding subunit
MYAALAALIGGGTPVRLALDRPDQFASGTKRHASVFDVAVAFDETGRLLAVRSKLVLDGGSQKDLTTAVKGLALHSSAGAYRFDHWDLRALAMRRAGPLSGSMRVSASRR